MPFKVNQLKKDGSILLDFDSKLELEKLLQVFSEETKLTPLNEDSPFDYFFNSRYIKLIFKNIVYSGNPASISNKRVQVDSKSLVHAQDNNTFILGIYSYDNQRIFCIFDRTRFIGKTTKSYTSAHINIDHLISAKNDGIYKNSRNDILFLPSKFDTVFVMLINERRINMDNNEPDSLILLE